MDTPRGTLCVCIVLKSSSGNKIISTLPNKKKKTRCSLNQHDKQQSSSSGGSWREARRRNCDNDFEEGCFYASMSIVDKFFISLSLSKNG